MINPNHLLRWIISPTLDYLNLRSPSAEALLLGTGLVESQLQHLSQLPGDGLEPGPGLGLFQMERATHDDIWKNYLAYRQDLRSKVQLLAAVTPEKYLQLVSNLAYSAALCRLQYVRVAESIPAANDWEGLARYWKAHYNTSVGKGTVAHFLRNVETLRQVLE